MHELIDVLIIGGGPAGCATALSLIQHNPNVAVVLVDDADPTVFKIGESLPPESTRLLHHLHPSLPRAVASGSHLSCTGQASSWASQSVEDRPSILNPFGNGWHLNRAEFDQILRKCVSKACGAIVKGKFRRLESGTDTNWMVSVSEEGQRERTFVARWIIDATGRKASVATKLGARTITSSPILAFYALFTAPDFESSSDEDDSTRDNDHRTFIEATPSGWFYTSLVPSPSLHPNKHVRVVAYHTLPSHPTAKLARKPSGFLDLLHSSAPHICSIISSYDYTMTKENGGVRCTAAGSSHLDKMEEDDDSGRGWMAVGDAACAFDPLSAMGMMTALEMGYFAGATLARKLSSSPLSASRHGSESSDDGSGHEVVKVPTMDEMYQVLRKDYEQKRLYYYSIVRRFGEDGEAFWGKVLT